MYSDAIKLDSEETENSFKGLRNGFLISFTIIICIIFTLLSASSVLGAISTTNLNGYWNFNTSLNLTDYKNSTNLTLSYLPPTYVNTPFDKGYNYTGYNQTLYANDTVATSITGNLTIAARVYINRYNSGQAYIVSKYFDNAGSLSRSYYLKYDPTTETCKGNLSFAVSSNSGTFTGQNLCTNGSLPSGWYTIVARYIPSTAQEVWINGVNQTMWNASAGTATPAASIADSTSRFGIGGSGANASNEKSFNGTIEEVAIYSRAWTLSEISQYANQTALGYGLLDTPPDTYTVNWSFDGGMAGNYTTSGNTINVWGKTQNYTDYFNPASGFTVYNQINSYAMFQASGVGNKSITYNFYNMFNGSGGATDNHDNYWNNTASGTTAKPVYSCDNGTTWTRVSTVTNNYPNNVSFTLNASCNAVLISSWIPYTYNRSLNLKNTYNITTYTNNLLSITTLVTQAGRPFYAYKITNKSVANETKRRVFITAGLHPGETYGSYQAEGIIRYLLNTTDSNAEIIRNSYIFYIIPTASIDGNYNGLNRGNPSNLPSGYLIDMNRDWNTARGSSKYLNMDYIKNYTYAEELNVYRPLLHLDFHGCGGACGPGYFESEAAVSSANYNFTRYVVNGSGTRYSSSAWAYSVSGVGSLSRYWFSTILGANYTDTFELGQASYTLTEREMLDLGANITKAVLYTWGNLSITTNTSTNTTTSNATYTDYYVSYSLGSDSNVGNKTSPWKTLNKAFGTTRSSCTNYYFMANDTWREAVSGMRTEGNGTCTPTIGCYGGACNSTNKWTWLGSTNAGNSTTYWTSLGGNKYESQANFTYEVYTIWYNTATTSGNATPMLKRVTVQPSSNGEFYWNTTRRTVTIYSSAGNPATIYPYMEIPMYENTEVGGSVGGALVGLYDRDNFTMQDGRIKYSRFIGLMLYETDNVYLKNIDFESTYSNGLWSERSTNNLYQGTNCLDCGVSARLRNTAGESIWISQEKNNVTLKNSLVEQPHGVSINMYKGNGVSIYNNTIINCHLNMTHSSITYSHAIYFDGTQNSTANNNFIANCTVGLGVDPEGSYTVRNISFQYNKMYNVMNGFKVYTVDLTKKNYQIVFDHNTLVKFRNANPTGTDRHLNMSATFEYLNDTTFTNNIVADYSTDSYATWEISNFNKLIMSNNLYFNNESSYSYISNGSSRTLAQIQAYGLESESVQANPQFEDLNDMTLRPLYNTAACNMSTTDSFIGAVPCIPEDIEITDIAQQSTSNTYILVNWSDKGIINLPSTRLYLNETLLYTGSYISSKNYNVTGLTRDTTYNFTVTYIDSDNNTYEYTEPITTTNTFTDLVAPSNYQTLRKDLNYIYFNYSVNNVSSYDRTEIYINGVLVSSRGATTNTYNATGLNESTQYEITIRNYDTNGDYLDLTEYETTRTFSTVTVNISLDGSEATIGTCTGTSPDNLHDADWNTYSENPDCFLTFDLSPVDNIIPTTSIKLMTKTGSSRYFLVNLTTENVPDLNNVTIRMNYTGTTSRIFLYNTTSLTYNQIYENSDASNRIYEVEFNVSYTTTQELIINQILTVNNSNVLEATICNEATGNCTSGTLPLYLAMFNGSQVINTSVTGYYPKAQTYTSSGNETTTITDMANVYINWKRNFDNATVNQPTCYYNDYLTNLIANNGNYYSFNTGDRTIYCVASTRTEAYNFTVTEGETLNTTLYWVWSGAAIQYRDTETQNLVNNVNLDIYYFGGDYFSNYTTSNGSMLVYYPYPGLYTLSYGGSGYTTRTYYIIVSNSTITPINLYLINSSTNGITNLTVTIIDETTTPLSGISVKMLRFDITTNTFILEEVGQTNNDGITTLTATLNRYYYKFMIQDGTQLLKITDPSILTDNTLTISVNYDESYGEDTYKFKDYTANLAFNADTNNFRLDYNDADGLGEGTLLAVYLVENMSYTLYNSSLSTSASGTIIIPVANTSGTTYVAYAYYVDEQSGDYKYLTGATKTFFPAPIFGTFGLLLQILLTIGVSSLIFLNAPVAVILTPVTLVFGNMIGWIQLGWGTIIGLMALGMVVGFMLMGGRR